MTKFSGRDYHKLAKVLIGAGLSLKEESIKSSVERALNIVESKGSDDIFKPPFFCRQVEKQYLKNNIIRNSIKKEATQFIKMGKLDKVSEIEKFPIPKNPYAYRNASFINMEDLIKYTALVFLCAENIENSRISRNKNIVFSYRYNKRGDIFSEKYNFKTFKLQSKKQSKKIQ